MTTTTDAIIRAAIATLRTAVGQCLRAEASVPAKCHAAVARAAHEVDNAVTRLSDEAEPRDLARLCSALAACLLDQLPAHVDEQDEIDTAPITAATPAHE